MTRTKAEDPRALCPEGFEIRLDLAPAATPRLLKNRPIHRWFWFPHSYSPDLVEAILSEWRLPPGSLLLDPFVGAGTTLLVARELGMNAIGLDLSPLAVWVSRVKTRPYHKEELQALADRLLQIVRQLLHSQPPSPLRPSTARLVRAFTPREYAILRLIDQILREELGKSDAFGFFRLALLRVVSRVSRAVADGGWFRWVELPDQADEIPTLFEEQVRTMLEDVGMTPLFGQVQVMQHDARRIHEVDFETKPDAVITSPPYPNRHDYTRAFHIELLFLGIDEDQIVSLRRTSLRSHVEARAVFPQSPRYREPELLTNLLKEWPTKRRRVPDMLRGYFEDLYSVFWSMRKRLKPSAKLAFVVGNVRHAGIMIPVDELLAEIGEQAGYRWTGTWVVRLRGNSAQQMGRYGRIPSRESIVFFERVSEGK